MATLIKQAFNWGGSLSVSEIQSIIMVTGSMVACRQMWCRVVAESPTSRRKQKVNRDPRKDLEHRKLQRSPYNDTFPPRRPCPVKQNHTSYSSYSMKL